MPFAKPANKKRLAAAVVLAGSSLLSAAAMAITPILVTETTDDGTGVVEGSFSWALQQAAATNGASTIVVATDGDIDIMATLEYGGTRGLTIIGSDQVIRAMDDFTLLAATEGADLTVTGLQFEGPGGFDLNNQSAAENPGKGIFVKVPEDATGRVDLKLTNVAVRGVANHGIHVSDCNLADDCGGGSGGDGEGSAASIAIHATNLVIEDAGNGKFDADGLRVDERDGGSIIAYIHGSAFMGVGADGVELDEGQNGSVVATITGTEFKENGGYCDPDQLEDELETFLAGAPDEDEFDEPGAALADLPGGGAISGTSDDRCFEYEIDFYDEDAGLVEAYEIGIDVDDGIDFDEAGGGSLRALMVDSEIKDNLDEGVDFDEEDTGRIEVSFVGTEAENNTDDGYKNSEEGGGAVIGLMYDAESKGNGGAGAVFEEEDNGNVRVLVQNSETDGNDGGDGPGVEAVQEGNGSGTLTLVNSEINDGTEVDGVTLVE